jgi:hypothetical protein
VSPEPIHTGGEGFTDSQTFAFADRDAGFFGLARAGVAGGQGSALGVLFAGREPVAVVAEGGHEVPADATWDSLSLLGLTVQILEPHARWSVRLEGEPGFELEFEAVSPPAELYELGGMEGHEKLCRVSGTAAGRPIDCLGQRTRAWGTADWDRITLTRSLGAWQAEGPSVVYSAVRPAGVENHAEEARWGALLDAAGVVEIDDPRLSTTYDGDGHQRRAGLELWVGDEDDYPRRGSGHVLCGSTVELGSLVLDCAFFAWTLDGREGVGRYDVLRRA